MTTRTEYAVQHTGRRCGANVQLTDTLIDPTSREQAEQVRDHILGVQAENDHLPIDAVIVTRTVTTTEWA